MARSVAWRRVCSDAASWHQDEALSATIYILREIGPTGFLLRDDAETKKVRVFVGDPHTCTCATFKKERDLCKHICWLLLKKFRVPRHEAVSWQLGLVEREINDLLSGIRSQQQQSTRPTDHRRQQQQPQNNGQDEKSTNSNDVDIVPQREITDGDICPVCQDELLAKHQPVTYCRHGCGNSVHIKCMTVWAEHQLRSTGKAVVECPFCRVDFGPLSSLQAELRGAKSSGSNSSSHADRVEHLGVVCYQCHTTPIVGKCYRCSKCSHIYLCQTCFNTPTHDIHPFQYREKPTQKWRDAPIRSSGALLPEAVVTNLVSRDISDDDYELLLQLDNNTAGLPSDLTESTVASFPLERVRANGLLLIPGQQCRICLRGYVEGDSVRRLPCRHKFHRNCIDDWLLHRHPTCPVDGIVYSNESVRLMQEANKLRHQKERLQAEVKKGSTSEKPGSQMVTLEIPGVSVTKLAAAAAQRQSNPFVNRQSTMPPNSLSGEAISQGAANTVLTQPHLLQSRDQSTDVTRGARRLFRTDSASAEDDAEAEIRQILQRTSSLLNPRVPESGIEVVENARGDSSDVIPSPFSNHPTVDVAFPVQDGRNDSRRTTDTVKRRPQQRLHPASRFAARNKTGQTPGSSLLVHDNIQPLEGVQCTTGDLLQVLCAPGLQGIQNNSRSQSAARQRPVVVSELKPPPTIPVSHVLRDVFLIGSGHSSSAASEARDLTSDYRQRDSHSASQKVKDQAGTGRLRLQPLAHKTRRRLSSEDLANGFTSLYIGHDPVNSPNLLDNEAIPALHRRNSSIAPMAERAMVENPNATNTRANRGNSTVNGVSNTPAATSGSKVTKRSSQRRSDVALTPSSTNLSVEGNQVNVDGVRDTAISRPAQDDELDDFVDE